jgi:hypothetical protein
MVWSAAPSIILIPDGTVYHMSEPAPKKRARANVKDMTDEQRRAHVRAKCLQHAKTWREKHAAYINERVACECGAAYTRQNKAAHLRTLKHRRLLEIARLTQRLAQQD